MSIDPNRQYWYSVNREQRGPLSGAELLQLVQSGQLQETDLYWSEGMAEWMPLRASGAMTARMPPPMESTATALTSPLAATFAGPAPFSHAPLGRASFGLFIGLAIGAFVVWLVGGVTMGFAASSESEPLLMIGGAIILGGVILMIATVVVGAIALYRAWAAIQGLPTASTTPGKAAGFMFIPFFNLYWVFVAVGNWGKEYNQFVRAHRLEGAPVATEGLFLSYAILTLCGIVPFINYLTVLPQMVIGLICVYQLCQGANYLKDVSERTSGV